MTGRLRGLARDLIGLGSPPASVAPALRLQALHQLGLLAAGLDSRWLGPVLRQAGAPESSAALGWLGRAPVERALPVAIAAGSWAGGDELMLCARPSSVFWTAWIGGQHLGLDSDHVEAAHVAGLELAGRLGGLHLGSAGAGRGSAAVHALAAAATAGRLLDLDEEALAHALALALARAPRDGAWALGSPDRVALAGRAALVGWQAAQAARAGQQGPIDVLDQGSRLREDLVGSRPRWGWLGGWGQAWLSATLTFPSEATSPFVAPALAALAELQRTVQRTEGRILKPADVVRIEVEGSLATAAWELRFGPHRSPQGEALWIQESPSRAVALALALGRDPRPADLEPQLFEPAWAALGDLPTRVHVRHDWALTLRLWERHATALALDRLLAGVGPAWFLGGLRGSGGGEDGVAASGPPLSGTGLNWSELPLAWGEARWSGESDLPARVAADPGAALTRFVERASSWVADPGHLLQRGIEVLGSAALRLARVSHPWDLAELDLDDVDLHLPGRLRLLEQGGRVWEADAPPPSGGPQEPLDQRAAAARARLLTRAKQHGSLRLDELADAVLAGPVPLPDALERLAGP